MENSVYIEKRDIFKYPEKNDNFNPSILYPEYPWGSENISADGNPVYDMVRETLFKLEMDKENFGTQNWNPFKTLIKSGDTVLLKPNMVLSTHRQGPKWNLNCIITNPAIVRAVTDYVYIALGGSGKIIIGDAPLQDCDFEKLINNEGFKKIEDFYKEKKSNVQLMDFRLVKSSFKYGFISDVKREEDTDAYMAIDLGIKSMLAEKRHQFNKFRVTNYDPSLMKEHHNQEINEYIIPKAVLTADVVINLPKPKTHRKAGITAALKNLVGINGHKDWLPHHSTGSVEQGGDEYLYKSCLKTLRTKLQEIIDVLGIKGRYKLAFLFRMLKAPLNRIISLVEKDVYNEGSWYGNDTIWRTICDLNSILFYCDKNGKMQNTRQRNYFVLADMIISGDHEGPLEAMPKDVGIIAAGFNPVAFDACISRVMGFDFNKIPSISKAFETTYPLINLEKGEIIVKSNISVWNNKNISKIKKEDSLNYVPSRGWADQIEI